MLRSFAGFEFHTDVQLYVKERSSMNDIRLGLM